MAGIKFLEKNSITINYIINQLLNPEIHKKLFDDASGITELAIIMYDPRTIIYGIFEQGKPEPIGAVWFEGTMPYRGGVLAAVIFDPKNRGKKKLEPLFKLIETDITKRFALNSCSSYVILPNEASEKVLEKLGFKKIGIKEKYIYADGQYKDLAIYYRLLGG
jgi:RimJ/RimL family protein N-acetyltransferase